MFYKVEDIKKIKPNYGFLTGKDFYTVFEKIKHLYKLGILEQVSSMNQFLGYKNFGVSSPVLKITPKKSGGYYVKLAFEIWSDVASANPVLLESVRVGSWFDYYEDTKFFSYGNVISSVNSIPLGFERLQEELEDLMISTTIEVLNKHLLNRQFELNRPEISPYVVQFDSTHRSQFIKKLTSDSVVWYTKPDFFLNLEGSSMVKEMVSNPLHFWRGIYGFVNVVAYVQYAPHTYYRDYLPQNLSDYEFKNIRTLIAKTSNHLDIDRSQHSEMLYELEGYIMSIFELQLGEKVGRVPERFYKQSLKLDLSTAEPIKILAPVTYKVEKKKLVRLV